ncbi:MULTISPECIES: DUF6093 family protein [unclassified Microbacterium]|uniref:DUF6093 family protein n=1 Tax=unclassified Microbacterium TaxID=2609290 RepID=UPI000EA87043|nr:MULTISPECIES: DUF6093 family protein [unclassified Microbacterium]MBT2484863.1 hypothetical protein [Microbacterium sp. ISL-108]RKN67733.1 hypothetical protein D7252_09100 [Microbacterium sp. CGR2]
MALSRPPSRTSSSWADEIRDEAVLEFNGEITVSTKGTRGTRDKVTGDYGPYTPGEIVLSRRRARAQHLQAPKETSSGGGAQSSRRYRFQCEILAGDPEITEESVTQGLVVEFTGGRDPELAKMKFQVRFATNSSHAALRTIETVTEGGRG